MPSLKNKRKPGLRGKSKKTNLRKTKKSMKKKTTRRGRRVHVGGMNEKQIKDHFKDWFRKTIEKVSQGKNSSIKNIVEQKKKILMEPNIEGVLLEKNLDQLLLEDNEALINKLVEFTLNSYNQIIGFQNREKFFSEEDWLKNRKKIFSDALDWYLKSHINYPEEIKKQQKLFYKNLDELRYVFFNSLHLLDDEGQGKLEINLEDAEVLLGCNFVQQNSLTEGKIDTNALKDTYKSLYPNSNNLTKIQLEERIKKMSNYDSLSENGLYTKSYLQKILDYLKLFKHEKDTRCH